MAVKRLTCRAWRCLVVTWRRPWLLALWLIRDVAALVERGSDLTEFGDDVARSWRERATVR